MVRSDGTSTEDAPGASPPPWPRPSPRPAAEMNKDDENGRPAPRSARTGTGRPTGAPSPGALPSGQLPPLPQRRQGPHELRPGAARQPTRQPVPISASQSATSRGNVTPE